MSTCTITGLLKSPNGRPLIRATVAFTASADPNGRPLVDDDGAFISQEPVVVSTGADGAFSVDLARGLRFTVDIPVLSFHKQITVPDEDTAELGSL